MTEEKNVINSEEIMETTIGDDSYYIVPKDEYDIVDYDEDGSEKDDFKDVAVGMAIGAGGVLLAGLAVKGIKKLVNVIKNKKQSKSAGNDYQGPVKEVDVEVVDEDFNDEDLTSEE